MSVQRTKLLQGTLDMLILKAVGLRPLHGIGVARRIEQVTRGTFLIKSGSLFPALHRMEKEGWLSSCWCKSGKNQRAKYYRLTRRGCRHLDNEIDRWGLILVAVARVLEDKG
jgi:PadR family transcriptional regulator PadR